MGPPAICVVPQAYKGKASCSNSASNWNQTSISNSLVPTSWPLLHSLACPAVRCTTPSFLVVCVPGIEHAWLHALLFLLGTGSICRSSWITWVMAGASMPFYLASLCPCIQWMNASSITSVSPCACHALHDCPGQSPRCFYCRAARYCCWHSKGWTIVHRVCAVHGICTISGYRLIHRKNGCIISHIVLEYGLVNSIIGHGLVDRQYWYSFFS